MQLRFYTYAKTFFAEKKSAFQYVCAHINRQNVENSCSHFRTFSVGPTVKIVHYDIYAKTP